MEYLDDYNTATRICCEKGGCHGRQACIMAMDKNKRDME